MEVKRQPVVLRPLLDLCLETVRPLVETYLASAADTVALAAVDVAAAQASYPAFLETFVALEEQLPAVGDGVSEHAIEAAAESKAQQGEGGGQW